MSKPRNFAPQDTSSPAMEWLWLLAKNHRERFPRADWPAGGKTAVLWQGWARAFDRLNVTQAEAEAASMLLMTDPPEYLDQHLRRLIAIIEGKRERAQSARNEGRFKPPPKYGPSDPDAVATFKRWLAARGQARLAIYREMALAAGEEDEIDEPLTLGKPAAESLGKGPPPPDRCPSPAERNSTCRRQTAQCPP